MGNSSSLGDNREKPDGVKGNLKFKGVSFIYPARLEGSIILYFNFNASNRVEEYQLFHTGGQVHCDHWPFGVWKVDHPVASDTIL